MVAFREFSGLRPRASDLRLAVQEAITAENVDLRRGFLRPRAQQKVWASATDPYLPILSGTPATLFRFRATSSDYWMYWTDDVDVAPGPVDSDDKRHYYTGDGVPKMFTEDSVADATPPYGGSPDTKYPYTWYNLGIPAPADAPDIDSGSLVSPEEGSAGVITELSTASLVLNCNQAVSATSGLTFWSAPKEGLWAGVNTTNIRTFSGAAVPMTCLNTGTRVRVASIVDADHVVIAPAGRLEGPIEDMGSPLTDAWRWDNALDNAHRDAPLTRPSGGNLRRSFFLLDNAATIEITNHTLREGDIIRITGSSEQMTWASTTTMVTSPVPTDRWQPGNAGFRTLTKADASAIVFSGTVSFMIERDGQEIDPVVPATSEFDISTRAYVYTYVSALGEESAPSDPTEVITVRDGNTVTLENFSAPPTSHQNIDRIWIYRSNTGTEGTAFQFVGELLVSAIAGGFDDTVLDEDLDEALETDGWDTPRSDMHSIVSMPNGIMAGLSGNRLCFSVPGFPHAWPREYEQLLDYDGVGLEVYGNSICVVTRGKPYIVTGVHPLQMSMRRIDVIQPGIDKRSIISTDTSILYASREGLISVGDDGAFNTTVNHYTKEQWLGIIGPDIATARTIRAWYSDSQYVLNASYTTASGTTETKLIFDFRDKDLRVTTFTETIVAGFSDPDSAELYYVPPSPLTVVGSQPANTKQILRWDYEHPSAPAATGYSTGTYRSGVVMLERPMSLAAARVLCRRVRTAAGTYNAYGEVTITLTGRRYGGWASSTTPGNDEITLINAESVIFGQPTVGGWAGEQLNKPFAIDVNTLVDAVYFTVTVKGPVEVESLQFAESMQELMSI